MKLQFETCSRIVTELTESVEALQCATAAFGLQPLDGREWCELLHRKLGPQLGELSMLIVAVVGGTNIGKSVIFNHIAGERISSTSPLASGTKHPIALISERKTGALNLGELFPGFQLRAWDRPDQPLEENPRHTLFHRVGAGAPANLIILDTPDIDSVVHINWERADHVRQSADVLVAVLTQQKYNDAAVKEFFRKAAQEDKLVLVVFNQCLLPDDEEFWPLWLQTFCAETGLSPHSVYLAPYDRKAAESNSLPFYERFWPPPPLTADSMRPRSLLQDLSELRFAEIKIQTLSGALRHVADESLGIPAWLREIEHRSGESREALELLSANRLVEVERWPLLPNSVLISHIRQWWGEQRQGWPATVHGFYNRVGSVISYPVRVIRDRRRGTQTTPLQAYREREWDVILQVLEHSLGRLTWLQKMGNSLLTRRLDDLLSGTSRAEILRRIRSAHERIDFDQEIRQLIDGQLQNFRQESPETYRLIRRLDSMAAAVRPALSVALFFTGAGTMAETIAPVMTNTALQGMLHLAGDAVGGDGCQRGGRQGDH